MKLSLFVVLVLHAVWLGDILEFFIENEGFIAFFLFVKLPQEIAMDDYF
jgi:hypothetical protein